LYFIKGGFKMPKSKKIIPILVLALLILLVIGLVFLKQHRKDHITPTKEEVLPTEYKRVKYEDGSEIVNYGTCTSKEQDEVCYLVVNESMLTLRNAKVTKEDGDSTDLEASDKNGLNSAILVTYNSIGKIETSVISTNGTGSSGMFINGRRAKGILTDVTINTLKTNSPGLIATNEGIITGDQVSVNTKVKYSPAIKVNNLRSSINLNKALLETTGSGSPIIETSGAAVLTESTGTANGSRIAIIKDNGKAIINNSSLIVGAGDAEGYKESAVLMHSKTKNKLSVFQSINSSLNINQNLPYYKIAYFAVVDNSTSEIDLENTAINIGSNKFLKATNSNVTINLKNQVIFGEFDLSNTKLQINLIDNSSYTGLIKDNNTSIYLSKDSELNLTGDMHIKELKNDNTSNNNIKLNGYHLYVNGELIK